MIVSNAPRGHIVLMDDIGIGQVTDFALGQVTNCVCTA
jgi:hypothetical protein